MLLFMMVMLDCITGQTVMIPLMGKIDSHQSSILCVDNRLINAENAKRRRYVVATARSPPNK